MNISSEDVQKNIQKIYKSYLDIAGYDYSKTEILNKEYYKRGPKDMDPEDLKYIGKHKSQIVYPEVKIPHIETNLINKFTSVNINFLHTILN